MEICGLLLGERLDGICMGIQQMQRVERKHNKSLSLRIYLAEW